MACETSQQRLPKSQANAGTEERIANKAESTSKTVASGIKSKFEAMPANETKNTRKIGKNLIFDFDFLLDMRRNGYKPEHRRESELRAGICNGIGVKANNKRGKAERIQRIVLFLNKLSEQKHKHHYAASYHRF